MEEGKKACPACGEPIQAAAHLCRFCGTDIDAYVAARQSAVESTLFSGHPAAIYSASQWVWVVLTFGIAAFVYAFRSWSTNYTITTQRVRIESGLLSKAQDNLELFRVDHFDILKPLGMRMMGYCSVHLHASDPRMPAVYLVGIRDLDKLADTLRECSLRERARRRVVPLEQM